MHALIVTSHPDDQSLTHAVAAALKAGIENGHTGEIADLAAEGFDPRYTAEDVALFRHQSAVPADVLAEQQRIDRADALVLVFPVYWWSFPALLKGWIDRVFTAGWAYDHAEQGLLQRLPVHLVEIAGAGPRTYDKHGYAVAMHTQIEHGVFGYCGARVASSVLLTQADEHFPQSHFDTAQRIGRELFSHRS